MALARLSSVGQVCRGGHFVGHLIGVGIVQIGLATTGRLRYQTDIGRIGQRRIHQQRLQVNRELQIASAVGVMQQVVVVLQTLVVLLILAVAVVRQWIRIVDQMASD